jgi:hypothetical protein
LSGSRKNLLEEYESSTVKKRNQGAVRDSLSTAEKKGLISDYPNVNDEQWDYSASYPTEDEFSMTYSSSYRSELFRPSKRKSKRLAWSIFFVIILVSTYHLWYVPLQNYISSPKRAENVPS